MAFFLFSHRMTLLFWSVRRQVTRLLLMCTGLPLMHSLLSNKLPMRFANIWWQEGKVDRCFCTWKSRQVQFTLSKKLIACYKLKNQRNSNGMLPSLWPKNFCWLLPFWFSIQKNVSKETWIILLFIDSLSRL